MKVLVLVLLVCLNTAHTLAPSGYLNKSDKEKLSSILSTTLKSRDLSNIHYAALGLKLLEQPVGKSQSVCSLVKEYSGEVTAEVSFHLLGLNNLFECALDVSKFTKKLKGILEESSVGVADLYFHTLALRNTEVKLNQEKLNSLLSALLKKDDSAISLGYAFHVASALNPEFRSAYIDRIEDALVQADEVNGQYLQFEGGLSVTALIVSGVFELQASSKDEPVITSDQTVKFADYFLSRKSVQTAKGVYFLLKAATILSNNKFQALPCVSLASPVYVSKEQPVVSVKVTNLLGGSLHNTKVKLLLKNVSSSDGALSLSSKEFAPSKSDLSLYELNFLNNKPSYGFYDLYLNVHVTQNGKPESVEEALLSVKVLTTVHVEDAEIGAVDADQSSSPKMTKVVLPNKIDPSHKIDVDYHQKLLMKFKVKDEQNSLMRVHQAFIKLTHAESHQEIIFVAEPDSSNTYKFDLDVNSKAKEFASQSGTYHFHLIIGDAVISNPVVWDLGDVSITFLSTPSEKTTESPYKPKPEITHLFRTPDSRPPPIVSKAFTLLCLAPLLLLLIMWICIGVNFSNFTFHPATLGFHLGLTGIFGVLVVFWLKLNMFETLKYLSAVGAFTFICGNNLLSRLATIRKDKLEKQK